MPEGSRQSGGSQRRQPEAAAASPIVDARDPRATEPPPAEDRPPFLRPGAGHARRRRALPRPLRLALAPARSRTSRSLPRIIPGRSPRQRHLRRLVRQALRPQHLRGPPGGAHSAAARSTPGRGSPPATAGDGRDDPVAAQGPRTLRRRAGLVCRRFKLRSGPPEPHHHADASGSSTAGLRGSVGGGGMSANGESLMGAWSGIGRRRSKHGCVGRPRGCVDPARALL